MLPAAACGKYDENGGRKPFGFLPPLFFITGVPKSNSRFTVLQVLCFATEILLCWCREFYIPEIILEV
jgi:hypothetical protein